MRHGRARAGEGTTHTRRSRRMEDMLLLANYKMFIIAERGAPPGSMHREHFLSLKVSWCLGGYFILDSCNCIDSFAKASHRVSHQT